MVMENEIRLGDIMDKLTPSDRVVIYNAARQVVYRGYAANAVHGTLNPQRRIKKMGLGMETYRATEQMPACRMCNFYKSTMSVESFRKQLETLPERLDKIFIYRLAKKYGIVKEKCENVKFYFEEVKNGGDGG